MGLSVYICLLCQFVLLCQGKRRWMANQIHYLTHPPEKFNKGDEFYYINHIEDMSHFNETLANILIPRVSGSDGNIVVRNFIQNSMLDLGWDVEVDDFSLNTVIGPVNFANIIATLDCRAPRRLILACHYDSKRVPLGFLGATDSAVPCAQMINLAKVMEMSLREHKYSASDVTLQLVFFDGEEAFKTWSAEDSIYGSRHLKAKWANTLYTHHSTQSIHTYLDRIDLLVLLDLLGAREPTILSTDPKSHAWYTRLKAIESSLYDSGVLTPSRDGRIFKSSDAEGNRVEDDHVPFMKSGVPILHMISIPFPRVWHKMSDDLSAVHFPTVEKLNKILRLFVNDYLQLI